MSVLAYAYRNKNQNLFLHFLDKGEDPFEKKHWLYGLELPIFSHMIVKKSVNSMPAVYTRLSLFPGCWLATTGYGRCALHEVLKYRPSRFFTSLTEMQSNDSNALIVLNKQYESLYNGNSLFFALVSNLVIQFSDYFSELVGHFKKVLSVKEKNLFKAHPEL